jgi:hypothetical protein
MGRPVILAVIMAHTVNLLLELQDSANNIAKTKKTYCKLKNLMI